MAGEGNGPLDRLATALLVSESRYLDEEDRQELLSSVQDRVADEFAKVESPTPTSITLTSQGGVIPVTIRNQAGYELRVRISLQSSRLEFLGGASREVTLSRPVQAFTFPVQAQSTGRFPVRVEVRTPGGAPISSSDIVVRSTAYNRVALVVTIGAAVFLALLWGRRFLLRRR
jgi:hypothetical protein